MSENLNGLSENWQSCLVDLCIIYILYWHIVTMRASVGANNSKSTELVTLPFVQHFYALRSFCRRQKNGRFSIPPFVACSYQCSLLECVTIIRQSMSSSTSLGKKSSEKVRLLSGIARISYPYPPYPQFWQLGPFFGCHNVWQKKATMMIMMVVMIIMIVLFEILTVIV